LPTYLAPVLFCVERVAKMTRLVLAGDSGPSLFRADVADLVVYFPSRFVGGPLPSPDKLASYLGARLPDQRPGDHWLTYVGRWPAAIKASKDLGLLEFCQHFDTVELWFDPAPNNQLQLIWLLDYFRASASRVALEIAPCRLRLDQHSSNRTRQVEGAGYRRHRRRA
jgi:hypothetical protein